MYNLLIKPFVRNMEKEKASSVALRYFKFIGAIPLLRQFYRLVHKNRSFGIDREVFGLHFYNPLGLGAGLDKKGEMCAMLEDLGFSFVEIGPLNAAYTRTAIANIQEKPCEDILAACISADITTSFSLAYDFCDFFVIDQQTGLKEHTIDQLLNIRLTYDEYKPIVLKLSGFISEQDLHHALDYCMYSGIDGVEVGAKEHVKAIYSYTKGRMPIIANCHIKSPSEAAELLQDGASLIELRSGMVYEGPSLVRKTLNYLEKADLK